jgi:hypothetical protein
LISFITVTADVKLTHVWSEPLGLDCKGWLD